MSSDRVWHVGPPPHVGWWNASVMRFEDSWRWWDGEKWSRPAWIEFSPLKAGERAMTSRADDSRPIAWTDYWPANARVPRINPEAK